jgi:hypothetical protein
MPQSRLRGFVSGYPDPAHAHYFPEDDDHPFWQEIDRLADSIHARLLAARPADPRSMGGLLTISSDTPPACLYFWVELAEDGELRRDVLAVCLDHISRARRVLSHLAWELTLDDVALGWDGDRFDLPA